MLLVAVSGAGVSSAQGPLSNGGRGARIGLGRGSAEWDRVYWPGWNAGLSPSNALTSPDSPLRLRVAGGSGVGGQINSAGRDFHYGIYRARIIAPPPTSSPDGTCGAFFFYRTDSEELDFELLSSRYGFVYFVVQGGQAFRIPVDDPANLWHVYEFRWYPGEVRVYLDGAPAIGDLVRTGGTYGEDQVLASSVAVVTRENIPSRAGRLMLNHWSGNAWAGSPPAGDSEMLVDWVEYWPLTPSQTLPLIYAGMGS